MKKRILQLCLSNGHGGLELYVARLHRLLRERGHDCTAMVSPGTLLAQRLAEQGAPGTEFGARFHQLPLIAARRLARFLERERIDLVHIHWSKDLPLAALAKRLSRRPVRLVHSRHMHITRPKFDPYHRMLYSSLDRLIVLSKVMHADARRYLPVDEDRIELVYLGVAAPSAAAQATPPPEDGILRIGQFSRIEHGKGQHVLIEAVDLLRSQGMEARARIVGYVMDERYMAGLRAEVARRGLGDRIEFVGFLPAPQQTMPGYDVIVLASGSETFGLVLIEAMRAGVAVVGTNAGGVPEIIEDGRSGLLFEPGSATDLAGKLRYLVENPERRREFAQAGRQRAERLFSEERHIADVESVLLEALDVPTVAA